jgi:hypothetical protein
LLLLLLHLLFIFLDRTVRAVWSAFCCCKQEVHKPLLKVRDFVNTWEEVDVNDVTQRRCSIRVIHLSLLLLCLQVRAAKYWLLLRHD